MKSMKRFSTILLICIVMVLIGYSVGAETKNRPAISDAERAVAVLAVQNTMSKHAYYHEAGKHYDELNNIWVKKDGQFAKTATFTNPFGVWEGMDSIFVFYGDFKKQTLQKNLEDISKVHPEIKNAPENLGVGGEWVMHTQTTPIIEVADDGKTAKGLWYSVGISQSVQIINGKEVISGGWFWEKYGADFVKEDGKWKIWHIQMCYDNTPPGWGGQAQGQSSEQQVDREGSDMFKGMPSPTRPNADPYKAWTPTSVPGVKPRLPEPYYTFSETFRY